MANLTRTFTGDLSSFIAGKVFDRVKEMMDDRKERESDPRVKKAAKKLEEKQVLDPESIPVVDDRLRQQVTKLFGSKIEARLFNLEASVDRTNAAITTIAAGIGDLIKVSVKRGTPDTRRQMFNAVVIRQKRPFRRVDGTWVQFEDNACVITNEKGDVQGSDIKGPVSREAAERWPRIAATAKQIV